MLFGFLICGWLDGMSGAKNAETLVMFFVSFISSSSIIIIIINNNDNMIKNCKIFFLKKTVSRENFH